MILTEQLLWVGDSLLWGLERNFAWKMLASLVNSNVITARFASFLGACSYLRKCARKDPLLRNSTLNLKKNPLFQISH